MRFIRLKNMSPIDFQSIREVLVRSVNETLSRNAVVMTQPSGPVITVGSRANVNKLVNLAFCREEGIPVIRTSIPHNSHGFYDRNICRCILAISVKTFSRETAMQYFYEAIIVSLKNLGIEATHPQNSNNIMIGESKLSVSSVGMFGNAIIVSCSLPLNFNYDLAQKALISPKDMQAWVTTINKELNREVSIDELWEAVKLGFQNVFHVAFEEAVLTKEEISLLKDLETKYRSEVWLKSGRWSPVKDYWRPT